MKDKITKARLRFDILRISSSLKLLSDQLDHQTLGGDDLPLLMDEITRNLTALSKTIASASDQLKASKGEW